MRFATPILVLFWLTFLTAPDSAPLTGTVGQGATDVNGEVELSQTGSGQVLDASQVVVWLVPTGAVQRVSATTQKPHYRLVQHNKRFEPSLLVVPVGSVVDFPNYDPWFHNVFSLYRGKRFDLGLYQAGAQRSVKFDRIGPSYLFCNIHPGMTGVVLAVAGLPLRGETAEAAPSGAAWLSGRAVVALAGAGTLILGILPAVIYTLLQGISVVRG